MAKEVEYVDYNEMQKPKPQLRDVGISKKLTIMNLHNLSIFSGFLMGWSSLMMIMVFSGDLDIPKAVPLIFFVCSIVFYDLSIKRAFKMVRVFGKLIKDMGKRLDKYEKQNKNK